MYLAIDVGGTKTLLAVFSEDRNIVEKQKFPTPKDYPEFIDMLGQEISKLNQKEFDQAVIAIPGKVDRTHGVALKLGNLPWENIPIVEAVEKFTHCPVQLENDANLAGLSEALEVINEYKKVLYVTVSTGIGSIFVVNGVMDANTLDSEVGHMLLEHEGELMIWESFASGRAITAKYGQMVKDITDPHAWYVISRNIAIGLIDLIAAYTPEAIILGGGVGSHLPKFIDRLEEELRIYENPMLTLPAILQAKHPEEAVIYGCFQLAKDHDPKTTH